MLGLSWITAFCGGLLGLFFKLRLQLIAKSTQIQSVFISLTGALILTFSFWLGGSRAFGLSCTSARGYHLIHTCAPWLGTPLASWLLCLVARGPFLTLALAALGFHIGASGSLLVVSSWATYSAACWLC